ncbi:MAG TPA: long-chain fatty acid--CoA ligase [Rhizobiaceae bacterium]|nr:long-chain fatty acid--CoA ligase [Rhizobiaceae bacterium]
MAPSNGASPATAAAGASPKAVERTSPKSAATKAKAAAKQSVNKTEAAPTSASNGAKPAKSKAAAARPTAARKTMAPRAAPSAETKSASAPTRRKSAAQRAPEAAPIKGKPTQTKAIPGTASSKPWLQSYPDRIPAEIGPLPAASIGELLTKACKQYAGRPAFTCMGKTMTYGELERHSTAFAAYLQSIGLTRGARIAIMMPNVLQYPVAMMAVLRAGYTVVNVNPLYTPRELEHQLKDSGAEAIVILENFATTLQSVIGRTPVRHVVVASLGDMLGGLKGAIVNLVVRRVKKMVPAWSMPGHVKFPAALRQGAATSFKPVNVSADDVAFLQYTGGTTGISKGATLLHRNVLANVAQNAAWVETAFIKRPRPTELVYACPLPLYHIYALTVNALMGMQMGAHNILIPNPRDIGAFVKELQKYRVNIFPGLNTLFNGLLNNEEFRKLDFKPLLLTFGGGMAVQRPVAERWQKVTGCVVSEGYGLSETSPVATANRFDADEFSGTIGLPLPSTEVAIRDEEGNDLPLGEVGEICIRGPQVMAGYWNRPDETAQVTTKDGFFRTGDMGMMDERGYTKIVDRKKDMILVSGFNVYPNELEEVVAQHPGVLEVAAIGVPDERSGEVPKLFVVKKDPALTADVLLDYCRQNLTGYKRPKFIEFRSELPKTNVGKILRKELRG